MLRNSVSVERTYQLWPYCEMLRWGPGCWDGELSTVNIFLSPLGKSHCLVYILLFPPHFHSNDPFLLSVLSGDPQDTVSLG
jgi:hypothetical protein